MEAANFEAAIRKQAHKTTVRALSYVGAIYLGLALLNFFRPPADVSYAFVLPSFVVGVIFSLLSQWTRRSEGGREVLALFLAGVVGLLFAFAVVQVSGDATSFYVLLSSLVGIGCICFDLRSVILLTIIAWVLGWVAIETRLSSELATTLVPQLLGTGALANLLTWIRRSTLVDAVESIHALKIRVSEERVVLESALDAVIISDSSGNILEWNDQAHAIFGWSRSEAIGRRLADTIVPNRYRDAHVAGLSRMRAGGEARVVGSRIEIEALHKSGREFPIELTIARSIRPTTVQYTAFLRDITERRSAERIQIRAREEAEEADRVKGEFLATISHEIRTPLNGIFGMTEMALETTDDSERRDFLERSQSCAQTLIALVGDVLDFSRFESGPIELEKISFDIRKISEGVLDTFALQASGKKVELFLTIGREVPTFGLGDPTRFRQVLLNLIGNAVKFTNLGHVSLGIRVANAATGTDVPRRLAVAVEDSGIGMAQGDLGMIFDVFRQADASTTRQFGGVGLGLAISQRLVALMGGEIQVSSVLGEGSLFTFEIPFPEGEADTAAEADCPAGRVLLWEAPGPLATHLGALFESWGSRVITAGSFAEVCQVLADPGAAYDLLVLRADEAVGTNEINEVLRLAQKAHVATLATCHIGELQGVRQRFPEIDRVATRPGNEAALRLAAAYAVSESSED